MIPAQDAALEKLEIYTTPKLVKFVKTQGFLDAPASAKYHLSRKHGLVLHSVHVMSNLEWLTAKLHLEWQDVRSPYIIGLLHDICKYDNYILCFDGTYTYNDNVRGLGHGDRSVSIIKQYMELTEEEELCIKYHMGAFTDKSEWNNYTEAIHKYPNVLYTHTADMMAAHISEANID